MTTHRQSWRFRFGIVVLLGAASLAGCAAMRRDDALSAERTLAAAGFQLKFADTPDKLANLATVQPQRKIVPQPYAGGTRFVYADAEYCKCLYAGTTQAYERYQKLAIQQSLAQDQLMAAQDAEAASMNWGMWGGWGPWY